MKSKAFLLTLLLSLLCALPDSLEAQPEVWAPEEWKPYAQRPDLMPQMKLNRQTSSLHSAGTGHLRCNGSWRASFPVNEKAYYQIQVEYLAKGVALPRRSILVQVDWRDRDGNRVSQPDYPADRARAQGQWKTLEGILRAPPDSAEAQVDLIFRWDKSGEVNWRNVRFGTVAPPAPREVLLATVNYRPQDSSGSRENLERFAEFLNQAGEAGADIVCLPEAVTLVGTSRSYLQAAEPIPGPSTEFLGKIASKFSMYIVAGLLEQAPEAVYNAAVLIGRHGELAGTYRKASLPREEIEGGITPGSDFPVFQTDFGKVGMMICWDVQFPEPARRLAAGGAEIILLPIWGGIEPLYPARAIENQIYLVTSSYDSRTGIWDREGTLVAEAPGNGTVAFHRIDLSKTTHWEWLGDLRSRIPREAPPARENP